MPTHFPDNLFDEDERIDIAHRVIEKLGRNRVLIGNSKPLDTVLEWSTYDEGEAIYVIHELAHCDDANLDMKPSGEVYLTEEYLDNPGIGFTPFGDDS